MRLQDIKIPFKIAIITVALSFIAVGYVIFLSSKMRGIDAQYTALLNRRAQGELYLSRANTRLQQIGYTAYQVLAYSGGSAEEKAASKNFSEAVSKFKENLDQADSVFPDQKPEIDILRQGGLKAIGIAQSAVTAGQKNDNETARKLLAQFDPLVQKSADAVAGFLSTISSTDRIATKKTTEDIEASATWSLIFSIVASTLGQIASLLMTSRTITRPLARLQDAMKHLAAGRLDIDIAGQDRRDEIGHMAQAVQVFKTEALRARSLEQDAAGARQTAEQERMRADEERALIAQEQASVVQMLADALSRLSDGDLTTRLNGFPPDYGKLQADFNVAITKLEEALGNLTGNGRSIVSGTNEMSHASDDMARRTEQQAASLEESAAALQQITAGINKTAEGAKHARDVVTAAKHDAEQSGVVVQRAVSAMREIENSAREINQIIGVIDEIAFQTNLLALNAGVEAARAGDAGRGFAVVASEVRALAQRSADAAKQIKTLISTSSNQVSVGVNLVGETGEALTRIVAQVSEIAASVSEIAESAQVQASGLQEVNAAVGQMDQITQQNAAMVEEATAASHSLRGEAERLQLAIGRFRVSSDGVDIAPAEPMRAPKAAPRPAARLSKPSYAPAPVIVERGGAVRKVQPAADDWEEF